MAGAQAKAWLQKQQSRLRDNQVAAVIQELLPQLEGVESADQAVPVRRCYRYLTNHREQMN